MFKVVTALAGILVCAGVAFADDGYKTSSDGYFDSDGYWRQMAPHGLSVYFGGHGGVSIANTEVGLFGFGSLDGIGSHGAIGGLHTGLDYILIEKVFFGAYGLYDWQSTKSNLSIPPFNVLSVNLPDSYGFGGRLGYDWGRAKAYGLVGWRHTDLEWSSSLVSVKGLPTSLTGVDFGAGIAILLPPCLELGIEGVWTKYDSKAFETLLLGPLTIDPQQLAVMGRLSVRFDH
jgi:hypothetical protein